MTMSSGVHILYFSCCVFIFSTTTTLLYEHPWNRDAWEGMENHRLGLCTGTFFVRTDFLRRLPVSKRAGIFSVFLLREIQWLKCLDVVKSLMERRGNTCGKPMEKCMNKLYILELPCVHVALSHMHGVEFMVRIVLNGLLQWRLAMATVSSVFLCMIHLDTKVSDVRHLMICFMLEMLLKSLQNGIGHVKTSVCFTNFTSEQKEVAGSLGITTFSWHQFLELGRKHPIDLSPPKPLDICTIMYTSGTTGEPKGVILTHETLALHIAGVDFSLEQLKEKVTCNDRYLSFLPLAHIFDRMLEEFFFHLGASVGYWQGDPNLLGDDLMELKPSLFAGVPRVFDRVYAGAMKTLSESSLIKRLVFNVLYNYKLTWMKLGFKQREASPLADSIVFNKIKAKLGGRVRLIMSGAAPLNSFVEEFLRVTTCAYVLQGYGLTETCGWTSACFPDEMSMLGTVGPPGPYTELRLEAVPEMGYDPLAHVPRGEICCRGKTMFCGYYKRDDLTQEAFRDGWFHTGDIGELQPDGILKIIDRKKNLFKLSQGEYIAVEHLENVYSQCSCIEGIWIYGNSFESTLVAVVVPNQVHAEFWAKVNGLKGAFTELCLHPELKTFILEQLIAVAKKNNLRRFEYIKAIHLDPQPFDVERDLITPTYKKKRAQLLKYYQENINSMYRDLKKWTAG